MARGEISIESALSSALPRRGKLVVAVSGGADSVALLLSVTRYWLVERGRPVKGRSVVVVHVDHKIRADSDLDQRFVQRLARRLKLPYIVRRLRNAPKNDIEAWARHHRYAALEVCRVKSRANWIVTAHTSSDLAETYLIKLLQNRDSSLLAARDPKRRLLRPLVKISRAQVEKFLNEAGEIWREDPSNRDLTFARNWVRHDLLPLLRNRWGSSVDRTLLERAEAQQADRLLADAWISDLLTTRIPRTRRLSIDGLRVVLAEVPLPARALFGVELLQRRFKLRVGRIHGAAVAALITGECNAVQLPGGRHLTIYKGALRLDRL